MAMRIVTNYEILEISNDGLVKVPKEDNYGREVGRFYGRYQTMEQVDKAIMQHGETNTEYVILTIKQLENIEL